MQQAAQLSLYSPAVIRKCRGGRVPRCTCAASLDESMTPMHTTWPIAGLRSDHRAPHTRPRCPGDTAHKLSATFQRHLHHGPAVGVAGPTICLPPSATDPLTKSVAPGLTSAAASQLGAGGDVSVLNVEQVLQLGPGRTNTDTNGCRPIATALPMKTD